MRLRILWIVDRPGWSFHRIARAVSQRMGDEFTHHIAPADMVKGAETDVAVVLWWRDHPTVLQNVRAKVTVLCLYDHVSWTKHPQDTYEFQEALFKSDVLVVGNETLLDEVRRAELLIKPTFICEDGVDCERFKPSPMPAEFTAGWCGNSSAGHGQIKGLSGIVEACDRAGVRLEVLDVANGSNIPAERMPEWYEKISCYICASSAEGTPNPALEAMASGRPVVTTRVGVMPRAVQMMHSGVFVERNADSIAQAIREVKAIGPATMGAAARDAAEAFDWSHKVPAWRAALRAARGKMDAAWKPAPKRKVRAGERPRVLLVADVRDWAFDQNERDMAAALGEWIDFDHYYVADREPPPAMSQYHAVFLPYHRWGLNHYWAGTPVLGSLRSADFDPDQPGTLPPDCQAFFQRAAAFHVVTRHAEARWHKALPNLVYLTNPVNMVRFPRPTLIDGAVIACWNGNARHASSRHADVKGFESIVVPACERAGVQLHVAEYNTSRLAPAEMPAFYRRSSVALCASLYEGASNSVMEAMASGLAVIATDAGNHREMVESQQKHLGGSGILLVERNADAFAEALRSLTPVRVQEMGRLNREEIAARWSWTAWRDRYRDFVMSAIDAG